MGVCKWAFVESLSCEGNPANCGPWNGKCAERSAYLQENNLEEPKRPVVEQVFKGRQEPQQAQHSLSDESLKGLSRAEIMRRDMERWRRMHRNRDLDFERER